MKWLPLHQWNNNWYDNRFIWASSSLWCYFVWMESGSDGCWETLFWLVREFVDKFARVCWRKTAHLRQKMTWYCLTPLNEKRNRSLITPTLQYLSAHPKPLHGSQSQTVTWALKLTQSSPPSLSFSLTLFQPLPLPRKIDSPNLKARRATADWEDLVSPFTGSNQAINDKKHVGLLDRRWGGREKNKRKEVQENGWTERKRERARIKKQTGSWWTG